MDASLYEKARATAKRCGQLAEQFVGPAPATCRAAFDERDAAVEALRDAERQLTALLDHEGLKALLFGPRWREVLAPPGTCSCNYPYLKERGALGGWAHKTHAPHCALYEGPAEPVIQFGDVVTWQTDPHREQVSEIICAGSRYEKRMTLSEWRVHFARGKRVLEIERDGVVIWPAPGEMR